MIEFIKKRNALLQNLLLGLNKLKGIISKG